MTTRKPTDPNTGRPAFGRLNFAGTVDVLDVETGEAITRLELDVYPVGSQLSARYDHPEGIALTVADAQRIGLEIERPLSSAAALLGRKGGSAGTPAQLAQRRAAAVRGGRPTTADRYLIIQPALSQGDPQRLHSGRVISRHRTVEAAREAYAKAHRTLHRREPQSWYDWTIVHEVNGERTAVPMQG